MKKLISKPRYLKFYNGGLIAKYQTGTGKGGIRKVPNYFKMYGIDGNKFISMFNAMRAQGASNQVAFEASWQALKERPKAFYSFGHNEPDVTSWAKNVFQHQLKRDIYKGAADAKNFDQWRKATFKYNTLPTYTNWLKTGREDGKTFMNQYIQENNLGEPIVLNNTVDQNQPLFDDYTT